MEHTIGENGFKRPVQECQAASFEALCTMFRHPAITSDPKIVCSLLRCCKSWRAALQHCCAGNAVITTASGGGLHRLPTFANFAAWLPKHAALVASIHWMAPSGTMDAVSDSYCAAAEPMLGLALQSTAAMKEAGTAPGLRLKRFETDIIRSSTVLREMPAASLTHLSLEYSYHSDMSPNNAGMAHAVSQLTNLRQLRITGYPRNLGSACIAAIGRLCCLTQLELEGVAKDDNLGLLPAQVQKVHLSATCSSSDPLALGHITALQELTMSLQGSPAPGSALPPNLRTLQIELDGSEESDIANLSIPGQQLQQLKVINFIADAQQVQHLASLPQLQRVELEYHWPVKACRAAPVWKLLPQLHSISIHAGYDHFEEDIVSEELLQGLGAASSLTALFIGIDVLYDGEVMPEGASVCLHLKGLQQLRELTLETAPPSRADAMHLTALTGLTSLDLDAIAVDDTALAVVACHLTQLQMLRLRSGRLSCPAALAVIGAMLTNLRTLALEECGNMVDDDIMLLTALTNLKELVCGGTFSHEAVDMFWRCMHEKQQVMQQQHAAQ